MKQKHQRLLFVSGGLLGLGLGVFLTLTAFREALIFYYAPSDLTHKSISPLTRIRVGGLVEARSVKPQGESVTFKITDRAYVLRVTYRGILPDLFREGQGVVAEGYLVSPTEFKAETVLAKHDEKYMPKEVADQLKKENLWRHDQ